MLKHQVELDAFVCVANRHQAVQPEMQIHRAHGIREWLHASHLDPRLELVDHGLDVLAQTVPKICAADRDIIEIGQTQFRTAGRTALPGIEHPLDMPLDGLDAFGGQILARS
ncbi:hypothetical protein WL00_35170 [Burkholderia cepacia]|nr:hypothetical protein WL00_35170 [Burkholderia cepacia]